MAALHPIHPHLSDQSDVVIRVEHLSKEYRLGTINHGTFQKDLQSFWARLWKREDPNSPLTVNVSAPMAGRFLALNDVSFDVVRGESLGIIGKNGAGKSTLLKILSRIVGPDRGRVRIRGRTSSLLELGAGFHQDLTGRDNIFMNGSILGMGRRDILKHFDEIVSFSEIEEFIDTPVKRYSSGMRVRLAFSIAVHLLADIVILDEVLAVGDKFFKEKCTAKMNELLRNQGRTLIFVTHSMASMKQLCARGLLLEKGRLIQDGPIAEVAEDYLKSHEQAKKSRLEKQMSNEGEP